MSPASRFPRPTTSDITKTGIELPADASEALDKELEFEQVESREARTHRLSTGVLIGIMALVLFFLLTKTSGEAHFAFTDALAGKELGSLSVSGFPVVLVSAIACLLAAGAFFMGRNRHTLTITAGVVAGIAIIIGFLSWAAAGRGLPFQVAGQLQGTLSVATPLVLGALCGVMCERAGVVNVAIEGQMLTAAFAAALVGSITKSIFAAIVVAIIASVLTAALLAVFTIKYFVDQVVMGVVVNLFASGLMGFFDAQLLSPDAEEYNAAPIMEAVAIPGLSKIPFVGPISSTRLCWCTSDSSASRWCGSCCGALNGGCGSGPSVSIPRLLTLWVSRLPECGGLQCSWGAFSRAWVALTSPSVLWGHFRKTSR